MGGAGNSATKPPRPVKEGGNNSEDGEGGHADVEDDMPPPPAPLMFAVVDLQFARTSAEVEAKAETILALRAAASIKAEAVGKCGLTLTRRLHASRRLSSLS